MNDFFQELKRNIQEKKWEIILFFVVGLLLFLWQISFRISSLVILGYLIFVFGIGKGSFMTELEGAWQGIMQEKLVAAFLVIVFLLLFIWGIKLESIIFLLIFLAFLLYKIDSRISAMLALLFLASCPVLLFLGQSAFAEIMAVYAYYFFALAVVLQIISYFTEFTEEHGINRTTQKLQNDTDEVIQEAKPPIGGLASKLELIGNRTIEEVVAEKLAAFVPEIETISSNIISPSVESEGNAEYKNIEMKSGEIVFFEKKAPWGSKYVALVNLAFDRLEKDIIEKWFLIVLLGGLFIFFLRMFNLPFAFLGVLFLTFFWFRWNSRIVAGLAFLSFGVSLVLMILGRKNWQDAILFSYAILGIFIILNAGRIFLWLRRVFLNKFLFRK